MFWDAIPNPTSSMFVYTIHDKFGSFLNLVKSRFSPGLLYLIRRELSASQTDALEVHGPHSEKS